MPVNSLYTEQQLLAKIAVGDQHAFRIIYEKYSRQILTISARLLHSEVLAEEVRQEVFLKFWTLGSGLTSIDSAEAYLRTLTRNLCLNRIRRNVLESKFDQKLTVNYVEAHNETEEAILLNDTRKLLDAAINSLPEQQRQVYLLCQTEGVKYEEAAAHLGISVNTLKTHLKRAMAAVRGYVSAHSNLAGILIILKIL